MSGPPANRGWLCLLQPSSTLQCWVLGTCAGTLLGFVGLTVLAGSHQAAECWTSYCCTVSCGKGRMGHAALAGSYQAAGCWAQIR